MIIELGKLSNEVKTHTVTTEKGDKLVLNNRIMIYQGKDRTTFVDITAWNGVAEFIARHFKQNDEIFIEGELKNKEITVDNKTFQGFYILVDVDNIITTLNRIRVQEIEDDEEMEL